MSNQIVLVHAGLSPFGIKCKLVLLEKGIPYKLEAPGPENLAAHPRREVPILHDGVTSVWDSRIICEYLEDKYPSHSMWPRDPALRAKSRAAMEVVDTHLEAINWGLGELSSFQRAGPPNTPLRTQMEAAARRQTANFFTWLSAQLSDNPSQPFFGGDCFSIGDCAVVSNLMRCEAMGIVPQEGSRLAKWWKLVKERASVKQVIKEDALDQENGRKLVFPSLAKLMQEGNFKREYRDHRLEWMVRSGGIDIVKRGLEKKDIRFVPDELFAKI